MRCVKTQVICVFSRIFERWRLPKSKPNTECNVALTLQTYCALTVYTLGLVLLLGIVLGLRVIVRFGVHLNSTIELEQVRGISGVYYL